MSVYAELQVKSKKQRVTKRCALHLLSSRIDYVLDSLLLGRLSIKWLILSLLRFRVGISVKTLLRFWIFICSEGTFLRFWFLLYCISLSMFRFSSSFSISYKSRKFVVFSNMSVGARHRRRSRILMWFSASILLANAQHVDSSRSLDHAFFS